MSNCLHTRFTIVAVWLCLTAVAIAIVSGIEDDFQFVIKWSGNLPESSLNPNHESVEILSNYNEKYKCLMPLIASDSDKDGSKESIDENSIKTSSLIVDNIHMKKLCSYRIESFWIYELCHGQYLKQYHETKSSGKRVVTDEYFLGYYDSTKQDPDYYKQNEDKLVPNVHWRNYEGQNVPMYAVKYTDGTPCEILGNSPRETTVFYVCDDNGNENIAFFEEVSSCIYEMVVVSKWICSHPAYRMPEKSYQTVNCYSMTDSPAKPHELLNLENDLLEAKNDESKVKMTDNAGQTYIIHYRTMETDYTNQHEEPQDTPTQQQSPPVKVNPQINPKTSTGEQVKYREHGQLNEEAQKEMIRAFLNGDQCLNGGTGWWKYEVCYKRHVLQYHEDERTKARQTIMLGVWNTKSHLDWIAKNPNKRPLSLQAERTTSSMYYSNGDICHELNRKRFVEVKFRCIRSKEKQNNQHTISLYLIEPSLCEYLLAVESPWLCDYVESLDSNGLPVEVVEAATAATPSQDKRVDKDSLDENKNIP